MRIRHVVLAAFTSLSLAGCHAPLYMVAEQFGQSSREYTRMLRWHEQEQACVTFVDPALKEKCLERAKAAKDVQVADYRVTRTELDPEKGEATVHMEFDFYVPPSATLKTVEDVQEWRYRKEDEKPQWRVMTLMPEFR